MMRIRRIVAVAAVLVLILSCGLFASAAPQSYSFKVSSTAQYGILDHKDGTAATIVSRSNNGWSCFEKWTIRQRDLSYLWYSKSGPYYTFQPGYKYKFTMELLCLRSYAAISNGTLTLKAGSIVIGKYVPVIEDSSSGYRIMRYDVELTVSSSMAWDSFIFDFTCIPTGTIEFAVTDNVYITSVDPNQEIVDGIVGGIVDGNGTPLVPDPGAGDAMQGIEDAENAALGGKTDEQINAEVNNALNFDMNTLDKPAAMAMANFFDGLLNHFGMDYQALLLLSLSLGLAAFIIGRRYKA